ncbi:ORF6N domain-containing protein [Rummeliibacillus pycnus]|uniref:ORF6N domain-containing protein n=1 Tax=Rummeliibacillus pycnus TaxID=101070 RepID=UPI0037C8EE55
MIFNDLPVLTTKNLAERLGVGPRSLIRGFDRQRNKFMDGKHFFVVTGDELVKVKRELKDSKHACILYLWTEEGAFLLAKFLRDVSSWESYLQNVFTYYEENRQHQDQGT